MAHDVKYSSVQHSTPLLRKIATTECSPGSA